MLCRTTGYATISTSGITNSGVVVRSLALPTTVVTGCITVVVVRVITVERHATSVAITVAVMICVRIYCTYFVTYVTSSVTTVSVGVFGYTSCVTYVTSSVTAVGVSVFNRTGLITLITSGVTYSTVFVLASGVISGVVAVTTGENSCNAVVAEKSASCEASNKHNKNEK